MWPCTVELRLPDLLSLCFSWIRNTKQQHFTQGPEIWVCLHSVCWVVHNSCVCTEWLTRFHLVSWPCSQLRNLASLACRLTLVSLLNMKQGSPLVSYQLSGTTMGLIMPQSFIKGQNTQNAGELVFKLVSYNVKYVSNVGCKSAVMENDSQVAIEKKGGLTASYTLKEWF